MFDFDVNYLFMPYYENMMHTFGAENGLCSVLFCSQLTSTYKQVFFNNLRFSGAVVYTKAKKVNNTIYWYGYLDDDPSDERVIFNTINKVYYYFAF